MATGEELMIGMGFYPSDTGPNVTELRKVMDAKASQGVRYVSPGTWVGDVSQEDRAGALLKWFTAIDSGMAYRVRLFDSGIFDKSYNLVTKKWEWKFYPENIIPKLLDTRDYLIFRIKKFLKFNKST